MNIPLFAGTFSFEPSRVAHDISDQQRSCFEHQRLLDLGRNRWGGDDHEAVISAFASALEQQLGQVENVLASGALAEPSVYFCLEPGFVCPYIPVIESRSADVEERCRDRRCNAIVARA